MSCEDLLARMESTRETLEDSDLAFTELALGGLLEGIRATLEAEECRW